MVCHTWVLTSLDHYSLLIWPPNYIYFRNCWPNMHMWHVCSPKHTTSSSRNTHIISTTARTYELVLYIKSSNFSKEQHISQLTWICLCMLCSEQSNQALAWSWGCCSCTQDTLTSSNHVLNTHSSKNLFLIPSTIWSIVVPSYTPWTYTRSVFGWTCWRTWSPAWSCGQYSNHMLHSSTPRFAVKEGKTVFYLISQGSNMH